MGLFPCSQIPRVLWRSNLTLPYFILKRAEDTCVKQRVEVHNNFTFAFMYVTDEEIETTSCHHHYQILRMRCQRSLAILCPCLASCLLWYLLSYLQVMARGAKCKTVIFQFSWIFDEAKNINGHNPKRLELIVTLNKNWCQAKLTCDRIN